MIIAAGIILILAGLAIWLAGNKWSWFGHLPGDIRIEKSGLKFYAPLASMALVSMALSLLFWLAKKFLGNG